MEVKVRLYTVFKRYGRGPDPSEFCLMVPANSTVRDVIYELGMENEQGIVVIVDGLRGEPDTPLKEGSSVFLLPPAMSGG